MIETVVCYLIKNNEVLMLLRNKKKNDINENKWIGVGGHIEENETSHDAVIREVKEETNLDIKNFSLRGIIYFDNSEIKEKMYVYTCNEFKGTICQCNEGTLSWINIKDIFNLNLWEGDKIFLKRLFDTNEYFEYQIIYKKDTLHYFNILK